MLNQHNFRWIRCQSSCYIKHVFLQIMTITTTTTISPRQISHRFPNKKNRLFFFCFATTFYKLFTLSPSVCVFFGIYSWIICCGIFFMLSHAYDYYYFVCVFGIRCSAYYSEKSGDMSKKKSLFRPANNRLKSVNFTKMFSVHLFMPLVFVDVYVIYLIFSIDFFVYVLVLLYRHVFLYSSFKLIQWNVYFSLYEKKNNNIQSKYRHRHCMRRPVVSMFLK